MPFLIRISSLKVTVFWEKKEGKQQERREKEERKEKEPKERERERESQMKNVLISKVKILFFSFFDNKIIRKVGVHIALGPLV